MTRTVTEMCMFTVNKQMHEFNLNQCSECRLTSAYSTSHEQIKEDNRKITIHIITDTIFKLPVTFHIRPQAFVRTSSQTPFSTRSRIRDKITCNSTQRVLTVSLLCRSNAKNAWKSKSSNNLAKNM